MAPSEVTVQNVTDALDALAPFALAEEWDNVGLLVGRASANVTRLLLTIDLTPATLEEAIRERCEVVVAYHPPIFRPLKRLSGSTPTERLALRLLEERVAVISPHTALDAAPGGLNDWIAEGIGSGDVRALMPHGELPASEETKVVTYCPVEAVDRLRDALASIGAGQIGDYERCSFELRGVGTFFGNEAAKPVVGKPGQLERVEESRLEMVCPRRALALAVETIRQFHPYQEPPIEIHVLERRPQRGTGAGRRLTLDAPLSANEVAAKLKARFGIATVQLALPEGAPPQHGMLGISAGSGGALLDAAVEQGCTLFITGELKHHEALAALERGCGVIAAGHTNTERGYLPVLAAKLTERLPRVTALVSRLDRDPFVGA